MKKWLTMVVVFGLLTLLLGGCGGVEDIVSFVPEDAVSSGLPEWSTTTTTEKRTSAEMDTAQSTTCGCSTTHTTTCRCPLTSRITTKTSLGSTNANCTYPTVPFTVGVAVRERDETFTEGFRGQVVTSKAQLNALALDEVYGTDEYTEHYFEDKALVVLEFRLTSGSIELQVSSVGVNGNTMSVFYTTVRPSPFTNDMAYHRILLEVSRKQMERVRTVVGHENRIYSNHSNPTVF